MNEKQLDYRFKYSACLCTPEKIFFFFVSLRNRTGKRKMTTPTPYGVNWQYSCVSNHRCLPKHFASSSFVPEWSPPPNMTCRHMGRSIVSSCLCQQRLFPVTAPCGGSPTLLVEKRQKMSLTPAALARSRLTSTLSVCTFLYWCDSVRGGSESIDKTASPADAPAAFRRIYWCSLSWTSGARHEWVLMQHA